MNPQQALELIDGVLAQVPLNRAAQAETIKAVQVLQAEIAPPVPVDGCEEDPDAS